MGPVVGDLAGQQIVVAWTHVWIVALSDTAAMGNLAADTAVSGADGRYTATLSPDWEIWGPNGGDVASVVLRAAAAHAAFEKKPLQWYDDPMDRPAGDPVFRSWYRYAPQAQSFTTIELKANFLGSAREGERVVGVATSAHKGRTTQVWDCVVTNESKGRTIALFRCTQMILYPSS